MACKPSGCSTGMLNVSWPLLSGLNVVDGGGMMEGAVAMWREVTARLKLRCPKLRGSPVASRTA
jgi:hypothetical protein